MSIAPFLSRVLLLAAALTAILFTTLDSAAVRADEAKEKEFLAVLQSDAPKADKAIACKQLAIHGSGAAVADLAPLLADPELASWSRIALEAIPGDEANEALRKAAETLDGNLLVGVINSIGVRRDAGAVEGLTKRLEEGDADVASAAAVALGRIGDAEATKALRAALASAPDSVRSAAAEGCVLCAEKLLAGGKAMEAAVLYDEVRQAPVYKQRIVDATRGAILAREDGVALLVEQLRSPDKAMFNIALTTAREFPKDGLDQALADELAKAPPERGALIVQAMADRPTTVILPAILQAAKEGPDAVRLSAVNALARVGDGSCVDTLLEIALGENAELAASARTTLGQLPGEKVDSQIVAMLGEAKGKKLPLLFEVVGQRRLEATPTLLKALESSDKTVRTAALVALGETVSLDKLSALIDQAVKPKHADDAEVALKALKAASVRMGDREACAEQLSAALGKAPTDKKVALLEILGAMGGTNALAAVGAAGKSQDDALQDASSKLLGVWMTADAAPVLLELSKNAPGEKYQVRALRGYLRIARQFDLPLEERVAMCEKAFAAAKQANEQRMVLDVLKRYASQETLPLAIAAMKTPAVKEDASEAALVIFQSLASKGVDVSEQLEKAGFEKVKVEIVKAEYGAGSTQKDVSAVLRKSVGDLPVLLLDGNYNKAFGGDPAPGSVKQLKIQYQINGKPGEATFAENALIVLPTPK